MMKCTVCGEEKPIEAFRTKARMKQCRSCESAKRAARAKATPKNQWAAIEAYRRYHEKKPAKSRPRDHKAEYQKYKAKKLIRAETKRLIAQGELVRAETCETCGAPNVEVHHLSYDRADNISWLCRKCHILQHRMTLKDVVEYAAIRARMETK